MHSLQRKVLRTICPDQKGLIARITNICYKHELNIVQNNEFVDHRTGRFFMRTELEGIFNDSTLPRLSYKYVKLCHQDKAAAQRSVSLWHNRQNHKNLSPAGSTKTRRSLVY